MWRDKERHTFIPQTSRRDCWAPQRNYRTAEANFVESAIEYRPSARPWNWIAPLVVYTQSYVAINKPIQKNVTKLLTPMRRYPERSGGDRQKKINDTQHKLITLSVICGHSTTSPPLKKKKPGGLTHVWLSATAHSISSRNHPYLEAMPSVCTLRTRDAELTGLQKSKECPEKAA